LCLCGFLVDALIIGVDTGPVPVPVPVPGTGPVTGPVTGFILACYCVCCKVKREKFDRVVGTEVEVEVVERHLLSHCRCVSRKMSERSERAWSFVINISLSVQEKSQLGFLFLGITKYCIIW